MTPKELTTSRKAFLINLDQNVYGTFAEIGAGQEVARHFFKVGGAAGTIAKSMSAYDMKFSDEIYGKAKRYVSRERLLQMLSHEYDLLTERLSKDRGADTTFFVYANTVAAASFTNNKNCHGWMGMRYQIQPESPPNDIIVHVHLWDKTPNAQQEALGLFGVNFIWASLVYFDDIDQYITSLVDEIGSDRIEVDILHFSGPNFDKKIENRVVALKLVENGLTNAVLFGPNSQVIQPSEAFYKKSVLIERGSFRPVTHVNIDMLNSAGAQFVQEKDVEGSEVIALMEMTVKNLLLKDNEIDHEDFLARIDTITELGYSVLVSNFMEYFRLSAYFRRFTQKKIGMVLGVNHLQAIFDSDYYDNLDGGILESFGRLFKANVKMYVYPMKGAGYQNYLCAANGQTLPPASSRFAQDVIITADNVKVPANQRHLYAYLMENHCIEPISSPNLLHLDIYSREVLAQIQNDDPAWEQSVPEPVAKLIKQRGFWKKSPSGS